MGGRRRLARSLMGPGYLMSRLYVSIAPPSSGTRENE
jgi:hypothetical protein